MFGSLHSEEILPEQKSEIVAPKSPKRVYPKKKRRGLKPLFSRGPLAA
jgi:hypothetical protein